MLVHPVFKSGSQFMASNYRPVSVPNSLNKIIERELYDQLEYYLFTNKLMDPPQYGFVKQKGSSDVIAKTASIISKTVDNHDGIVLISLDLSKAFDTVNHNILINKMKIMGIGEKAIKLTKSYLSDRVQIVKVGNSFSCPCTPRRGLSQGTTLAPLLFSIYIADMKFLKTHSRVFKFADDVMMIFEIEKNSDITNVAEKLKKDLNIISEYYRINKLKLNLSKSQAVYIGKSRIEGLVNVLNEFKIPISREMKYLGVIIDEEFKFDTYYTTLKSKLCQAVGAVSVMRKKLLYRPLINFYMGHFQSHLMYTPFLLLKMSNRDIEQLQTIQNRILKMIFNLPMATSTEELFTKHAENILPIMGVIFYVVCRMIHKSLNYPDESLIKVEKLRSSRLEILKINKSTLMTRKNDTEIIGPSLFNSIPSKIRTIQSSANFKAELKKFLLSKNASLSSKEQISLRSCIL